MALAPRNAAALLALALALLPSPSEAHGVQVDGSASEWFGTVASLPNVGRIARRAGDAGEYVWRDAAGDARSPLPGRPGDLLELRVTGDHTRLYVMAVLATPVATIGDGVPQLQLAIDLDRMQGFGGFALSESAATQVGGAGAFEWLLQTRFGSGQAPRVSDAMGGGTASSAQAAISSAGVIEISVPWSDLGCRFVPENAVRISAALFLSRADDQALDPLDGVASRAADVVTQNGGPGLAGSTLTEVTDGVLDYAFDVWFGPRGDVISPIVVNEGYFDVGANSQWIELANATRGVVALGSFKVGDEEQPGGNEGMASLPAGKLLVPGQAFVIANNGAKFFAEWGAHADAEVDSSDPASPDMLPYTPWAADAEFHIPNSGDQVLVLDGANTVVDVLAFGNGSYPGVLAVAGVGTRHSIARRNPGQDTDDCVVDFMEQFVPTPFQISAIAGVGEASPEGAGLAWGPPRPNPVRGNVALALRVPGSGPASIEVLDAAGRLVRKLFDGPAGAGELRLQWDSRDANGHAVPPGLYFVQAVTAETRTSTRLVVVR